MPALEEASEPDDMSGGFRWIIPNWSKIRSNKHRSERFVVGGFSWQLLVFPQGNSCDHLSVYLDVAEPDSLPLGWAQYAQFSLAVECQNDETKHLKKDTNHTFEGRECDWGFTQFAPLSDITDPSNGYLVNDTLIIVCELTMRKDHGGFFYDSRKETGFIGLKNQGATCYMNSLLQTLFHIPYFRKAVYHMPTTQSDSPESSIPLALQSLFYKVQFANSAVATQDLTRSFGWDAYDSFTQHDVQELNRVLCEKLEEKMKGTSVEGTIQKLFEGHTVNYINCINVDYKSTRKEAYLDLQLDVKGCKDVYASFDKYIEVEKMDGENKYRAEGHGLQDAEKGVLFTEFPPVLQLQLKRFEYDFQRDTMVKINDRYEFPEQLDLDAGDGKYLSPDADRSVRNKYLLHSVLVHSGGVNGGHYYAYIRPDLRGQWFKFDDERVTKEEVTKALDEQYGEDEGAAPGVTGVRLPKFSNAYMLVYVRESDISQIICEATENDIAEHLRVRLKKEKEEKDRKMKEKAEAHLYTQVKLATRQDMAKQVGEDIYFDLVDHDGCANFRVSKQTPFADFKKQVAAELGVPPERQRYWAWAKRQNQTFRPNNVFTHDDEAMPVGKLQNLHTPSKGAISNDLKLLLEVVSERELAENPPVMSIGANDEDPARALQGGGDRALLAPPVPAEHILLFFKFYDPRAGQLKYLGHMLMHDNSRMNDNKESIMRLAAPHLRPGEDITLYEEIKFDPLYMEKVEWGIPLKMGLQLDNGDIICIEPKVPESEVHRGEVRYQHLPSFLEYIRDRQRVVFRELVNPREDKLTLDLSKSMSYDAATEALAGAIGVADPTTIRLTSHNSYSNAPKLPSIAYRGAETLIDMLAPVHSASDILYYEVLDMPLPELERLKSLKISFHGTDTKLVDTLDIRMPRESCVRDVLEELRGRLGNKVTPGAKMRFMETYLSKIYKVLSEDDKIEGIDDAYWVCRAEEVDAKDEVHDETMDHNAGDAAGGDMIIHVYHFYRDKATPRNEGNPQVHNFGDPFLFRIGADEPLRSVKRRVQQKLGVPDDEFGKWKWAYHSLGRTEYLEEDDIVASRFVNKNQFGAYENYLGMEHEDKNPRKTAANNRYGGHDQKAIKIHG